MTFKTMIPQNFKFYLLRSSALLHIASSTILKAKIIALLLFVIKQISKDIKSRFSFTANAFLNDWDYWEDTTD